MVMAVRVITPTGGAATRLDAGRGRCLAYSEEAHVFQPGQDLLAGGEVHQGRSHRVLPRHRTVDSSLSEESSARDDTLSRRHRGQAVLSEGCAGVRARLDPHAPYLEQ